MATTEQLSAAENRVHYLKRMASKSMRASEAAVRLAGNPKPNKYDLMRFTLSDNQKDEERTLIAHHLQLAIIDNLPMLYALVAARLTMDSRAKEAEAKLLGDFLDTYLGHIIMPMTGGEEAS